MLHFILEKRTKCVDRKQKIWYTQRKGGIFMKTTDILQKLIRGKEGFSYRGIIYLEKGDPRLAYEWVQ